jgi:hydroxymethylpyrimidine pyrophosphatase-like HAD family hydrolase
VRASGRLVILVTGRILDDLRLTFHQLQTFDRIVAENGAVLFDPRSGSTQVLAPPPPPEFLEALLASQVAPVYQGMVIVATLEPHQITVLETIRRLGLELELIFNKGDVMVLPTGVNKGTGLRAALTELGVPAQAVVAIGDAENDHSFLSLSGVPVAVANAIPSLQERAAMVTRSPAGQGVIEVVDDLLATDLTSIRRPT